MRVGYLSNEDPPNIIRVDDVTYIYVSLRDYILLEMKNGDEISIPTRDVLYIAERPYKFPPPEE